MPLGSKPLFEPMLTIISSRCRFTLPLPRKGSMLLFWHCYQDAISPQWNSLVGIFIMQWQYTASGQDHMWSIQWQSIIKYNAESSLIRFHCTKCTVTSPKNADFCLPTKVDGVITCDVPGILSTKGWIYSGSIFYKGSIWNPLYLLHVKYIFYPSMYCF